MTYKTHLSFGLLASAVIFLLVFDVKFSPVSILILIGSTALGSSAPDLDTPTAELWQKVPVGSVISRIVHPVFLGGHRHLSHSFLGFGVFSFLFYLLISWFSMALPAISYASLILLAFEIGYLSHLLADMFTEAGVPLLFPLEYHFGIPPDPFGKIRIKTGRWFENLIIYPAVNIALVLVIYEYLKKL